MCSALVSIKIQCKGVKELIFYAFFSCHILVACYARDMAQSSANVDLTKSEVIGITNLTQK